MVGKPRGSIMLSSTSGWTYIIYHWRGGKLGLSNPRDIRHGWDPERKQEADRLHVCKFYICFKSICIGVTQSSKFSL